MAKKRSGKIVFTLITIGFIAFIFHNSMFPGPQSSSQSQWVMKLINNFLKSQHAQFSFSELFIRKAGHFSEYFIFGVLLTTTIRTYGLQKRESVFLEMFCLLLVPVFDELIQVFTPERGSSVIDVLLDFTGGLTAMMLIYFIQGIRNSKQKLAFHNSAESKKENI